MRLEDLPESSNVEDRRGMKMAGGIAAGGGGLLLLILGLVFGVDTNKLGGLAGGGGRSGPPPNDKYGEFAGKILGSMEAVWEKEFAKRSNGYPDDDFEKPKLVLFSEAVSTGCGNAPSSVGPFYCPRDKTIYLDPTFFDELEGQLGGSKAQFSQAYVIGHEFGHHVQNLIGFSGLVDRQRGTRRENEFSTRLELQADYLAGVWAHQANRQFNFIQPGDVDTAIQSAKSIGDDVLQKRSGGFVHPEKFTHGTAAQRVKAFKKGFESGDARLATLEQFFKVPYTNGQLDSSLLP